LFKFDTVGKQIKIKTCILLLAWLVIFAHSIIPHHHSDDNCMQATSCCHSSASAGIDDLMSVKFLDQSSDARICHLSNLLFQNFNPENFLPSSVAQTIFLPVCISGKTYINSSVSFISPGSCSTIGFRAPPSA
jgi:hypothetical protein